MLHALTRSVPPSMETCELTHVPRTGIDVGVAVAQHAAYERVLGGLGCRVERVAAAPDMPDSVFIEDTALVFDEIAVMMRPGAESRRKEGEAVEAALSRYRARVAHIVSPGTMDGGDVLCVGRRVFVGRSSRTTPEAIDQLRSILAAFGYEVVPLDVDRCLHLKSAVTAASDTLLVLNPALISRSAFSGFDVVEVPGDEPEAANVVRVGSAVLCAANAPRTRRALEARGLDVHVVDASELAKAEGALTCCSLIFSSGKS